MASRKTAPTPTDELHQSSLKKLRTNPQASSTTAAAAAAAASSDPSSSAPSSAPRNAANSSEANAVTNVIVEFQSPEGDLAGPRLELPLDITVEQLQVLINRLLENDDSPRPYSFFVNGTQEIVQSLRATVEAAAESSSAPDGSGGINMESALSIVYQPQAIFRVREVTRCTSSLPGHSEAILHVSFSPDGQHLASGSGDATVRVWDVFTETPRHTLKGHRNWVLAVAWSPDGQVIASGSMDSTVRLWDPKTGKSLRRPLSHHRKWITSLAWEPLHRAKLDGAHYSRRLATASKDGTVKIWDTHSGKCQLSMSGHTAAVKCVVWGGEGLVYSGSQDRMINVWDPERGTLVRQLKGHAHWVNCLTLSTGYALRTGAYDQRGNVPDLPADTEDAAGRAAALIAAAKKKYDAAVAVTKTELLVSASDDFTCFIWDPTRSKRPILRMTGHQQPVNFVAYSPNGRLVASASFDNSVRLWDGITGKFLATFRGHVESVYQVCWSADSRLLVSSSKDSTLKVWNVQKRKVMMDLPGHADEVYAVDWSPDGERVASGGKDHILKVWRN